MCIINCLKINKNAENKAATKALLKVLRLFSVVNPSNWQKVPEGVTIVYLQQHETRNCTNIHTLFLVYAPFHVYTQSCTLIVFVFRVFKLVLRCYSTGALHIIGSINIYNAHSFSRGERCCVRLTLKQQVGGDGRPKGFPWYDIRNRYFLFQLVFFQVILIIWLPTSFHLLNMVFYRCHQTQPYLILA